MDPESHSNTTIYFGTASPRSVSKMRWDGEPQIFVGGFPIYSLAFDPNCDHLYVLGIGSLSVWRLDGSKVREIRLEVEYDHIACDPTDGNLFLAKAAPEGQIVQMDPNGQNLRVIVSQTYYCQALAFDSRHRALYWAGGQPRQIWKAERNGCNPKPLITELNCPCAICIDEQRGQIFWIVEDFPPAAGRSFLRCADLNGNEVRTLFDDLSGSSSGMGFDFRGRRLVWIERPVNRATHSRIRSVRENGKDRETLYDFSSGNYATGLALV